MNTKAMLKKTLEIDDLVTKKHSHSNKSTLDTISQTNINSWNDKYTKSEVDNKISAVVTSLDYKEHVLRFSDILTTYPNPENGWTVSVDEDGITYKYNGTQWIPISANSIPLATNSIDGKISSSDYIKLQGISTNATKVESSTTNGNVKIDGVEKNVYTHPTGTNPHGTTKSDVGLSNVDNTSDLNKPISTAIQSALNGKANTSHVHDDRYYTETEINNIVGIEPLNTVSSTLKGAINELKSTISSGGSVDNADKLNNMLPSITNTANTIVARDTSGNFSAGTITANLNGNANTSSKWAVTRTFEVDGSIIGSTVIDGSENITITATVVNDSHNHTSSTITDFLLAVKSTVLTGLSTATNSIINTTDTILGALGKLQAQITSNLNTLTSHISNTNNPHGVNASQIGLGNVTNESKITMFTNPIFTGTVTIPTATVGDNSTKGATTAFVATAINNKTTITGNAGTATKLENKRAISIVGDVVGTADFDGSENILISTTLKTGLTWNDLKGV